MINNSTSSCKNCMVLIRIITAESILRNVRIFAKHVSTKNNGKADALVDWILEGSGSWHNMTK